MLRWLEARARCRQVGRTLYGAIVAQARTPGFYRDLHVPDTMEGRVELIMLHMALILRRLGREGAEGRKLGRAMIETFIADMDDTLREMGVSDLGVPRRVKKAATAAYERARTYADCLDGPSANSGDLEGALSEHVYAGCAECGQLARYVLAAAVSLDQQPMAGVRVGDLAFPVPVANKR